MHKISNVLIASAIYKLYVYEDLNVMHKSAGKGGRRRNLRCEIVGIKKAGE